VVGDEVELKLYLEVCFDWLLFLKENNVFISQYECTVVATDKNDNVAINKTFEKKFILKEFEKTNSRSDFIYLNPTFKIKPGNYVFKVEFRDLNARKSIYIKKKIKVKDFRKKRILISDILFANKLIKDSDGQIRKIIPNIGKKYNNIHKNFYAYFEVVSREKTEKFEILYEIENFKRDIVQEGKLEFKSKRNREQVIINLGKFNLYSGRYTLFLSVRAEKGRDDTKKSFLVYWVGVPNTEKDLNLAIEQMRYIPDAKKEIKKMKKLPFEKKRQAFIDFWKDKDPYPETPTNEFLEGYFTRVANSNELFTTPITSQEGWQTDMGMVYILFGPPNEIQRHPFEAGSKPYQIWFYYSINRSFVFVDEIGFGLYRLTGPLRFSNYEVLRF